MDFYTRTFLILEVQGPNELTINRRLEFMLELCKSESKTNDLIQELKDMTEKLRTGIHSICSECATRDILMNLPTLPDVLPVAEAELTQRQLLSQEYYYTSLQHKLRNYSHRTERRVHRLERELKFYDNPVKTWNKIMDPALSQHTIRKYINDSRRLITSAKETLKEAAFMHGIFRLANPIVSRLFQREKLIMRLKTVVGQETWNRIFNVTNTIEDSAKKSDNDGSQTQTQSVTSTTVPSTKY